MTKCNEETPKRESSVDKDGIIEYEEAWYRDRKRWFENGWN